MEGGRRYAVVDGSKLPEGTELGDVVKEIAEGQGPTITIDTTGAPPLINAGIQFTRNRGKIVQVGSPPLDFQLEIDLLEFMLLGKQLLGATEGQAYTPEYVPKMVQRYREGKFPFD
jgi:Zn-dependent alcohol dehydrogenase